MLAVEIMDTAFMNSIGKWKKWDEMLSSWFLRLSGVATFAHRERRDRRAEAGVDRIALST